MEVKAKLRHYHVAPRKVRLIIDLIRGLDVERALEQLGSQNKRCVPSVIKLLNSAIANAVNNFQLERNNLYIKEGFVDQGPVLKRWRPRAHGRAGKVLKKTSHVTLILGERVASDDKKKKDSKEKKEIKTKKVDLKDIKKASKNFKGDSKTDGSSKQTGKQSKTTKSFIRKTGDK